MKTKELIQFFKDNDFKVFLFEQDKKKCAELEIWTSGGVDMIISLMPFTIKEFVSWVNDFDVDEEIMLHRQDKSYCEAFTIRQALEDFEEFKSKLESIVGKIEVIA